jgi:hypothetical protein
VPNYKSLKPFSSKTNLPSNSLIVLLPFFQPYQIIAIHHRVLVFAKRPKSNGYSSRSSISEKRRHCAVLEIFERRKPCPSSYQPTTTTTTSIIKQQQQQNPDQCFEAAMHGPRQQQLGPSQRSVKTQAPTMFAAVVQKVIDLQALLLVEGGKVLVNGPQERAANKKSRIKSDHAGDLGCHGFRPLLDHRWSMSKKNEASKQHPKRTRSPLDHHDSYYYYYIIRCVPTKNCSCIRILIKYLMFCFAVVRNNMMRFSFTACLV